LAIAALGYSGPTPSLILSRVNNCIGRSETYLVWLADTQIGDLKLSKALKEKLLGSDREGLGIGIRIVNLKLPILAPVKSRSPI